MRQLAAGLLSFVLAAVFLAAAAAAKDEIYTSTFSDVAVGGYDPVTYFAGMPQEGSSELTTEWKGAEWRFVSQGNLDKFKADPMAFAPRYGGYCAWAVSQGYTASADPEVWTVVDGKLYLNYSRDVQADWEKDIPGHIAAADKNWPGVLK